MQFRFATEDDAALLLQFIRGLAIYQHMEDEVQATEADLTTWMFEKHCAEALIALRDGREVGVALFYTGFSTFKAKGSIYLEALYVLPDARKEGFGVGLMQQLAKVARDRGLVCIDWDCLDWNTPSLQFYRGIGAKTIEGRTTFRLAGDSLQKLAVESE